MFGIFEPKKKKFGAVKIVLICVAGVSAAAAAASAFVLWKEKKTFGKYEADKIDSIIDEELGDDIDAEFDSEEIAE